MPRIGVIYYSRTGNTEKMAQEVAEGVREEGVEVILKRVEDTTCEDLLEWDGIIVGSPTYYGICASPIVELLDQSVKYHGRLEGKVGAAFSSSANVGGGNETTILSILEPMLIHGMIVQGDPSGDHYGPVSVGSPDERARKCCRRLGKRVGALVKKLFS